MKLRKKLKIIEMKILRLIDILKEIYFVINLL